MEIILNENKYNDIWSKIFNEYKFKPSTEKSNDKWISLPVTNKKYRLNSYWTETQEITVKKILKDVVNSNMYALDWHHDCFIFNSNEDIPYEFNYYDVERDTTVYFPTFYPDGDYYFFVSIEWEYGIFGHPWRKEIIIMGQKLIEQFDLKSSQLDITILEH